MDNTGTIKVGIYDKGGGRFERNALAGATAVCEPTSVSVLDVASREAVERLRQFTHIVCHLSGDTDQAGLADPSWPHLIAGDLSTAQVIIRVSSQGAGGMAESYRPPYRHNKGPWILHLIEPSGSVTIEQWKKVFRAFKEWDTRQPDLPEGVRAIFDTSFQGQALRWLCEAWLFAKGEASKPLGNITIRAPIQPSAWFSPFGETCSTDAADSIARKMGKAEGVAVKLLRRLAKGRSGSVTWESYRDDVARLATGLDLQPSKLTPPLGRIQESGSTDPMNIIVLGEGSHARAMAHILGCRRISRDPEDCGWTWPKRALGEHVFFAIMAGQEATTARVIRWHSEAWRCPRVRQVRCAIIGLPNPLVNDLARCDIFGRIGESPADAFAGWSQHITLLETSAGLLEVLNRLTSLSYCPVTAWNEAARRASVLPPLLKAIRSRTCDSLHAVMPAANQVNWDAICPQHTSAHRIRMWLTRVTSGVTQDLWNEGEALFAPLTKQVER